MVILVGLGGNLDSAAHGSPRRTLAATLDALAGAGVRVVGRSGWYRSAPVPVSAQPWFVNAVAVLANGLDPFGLLDLLLAIEIRFGRVRGARNAARTVDLDLLDYEGRRIAAPRLTLPHPRLAERRFVLAPLAELAPQWRHPASGLSAAQLLAGLPPGQPVERMAD
jgi:2-amino-4-hydroxy-6-hydroxymethyldihydropteridine diphosphokinase